ncbi:hypothetical protein R1sor_004770 [Riccia sorocarpa]|uniref:Uncharacterized protein n=1 Tax=Riccia sorocarpa TaxID=122646 RepID=A0ABD3HLK4_9MARC
MEREKPRKLNDSVYEFYGVEDYKLEVVAFHGLCFSTYKNAYITTWQDRDEGRCWLRDFIAKRSPEARVLSVSYDSCAQKSDEAGRMTFSNLGRILVKDLIHLAKVGQRGCPVVLIGYCLGGLVIEQLCIEAEKQYDQAPDGASKGRLDEFLTNVRAVLYLDTPHAGSTLGDYLREKHQCEGPVLEYLSKSSSSLSSLSREFDSLAFEKEWERFICWYGFVTTVWDSKTISTTGLEVVTESSCRRDAKHFFPIKADHSGNAISTAWNQLDGVWDKLQGTIETIRKRMELPPDVSSFCLVDGLKLPSTKSSEVVKQKPQEKEPIEVRESDELCVMYEPDDNSKVELELIFFPGTANDRAYKSTWMSKDGKDCWLQTWLPQAFPTARILAVSLLAVDEEEFDLELNCENLIDAITSYHQKASWRPLILVGHCKGGLIIKRLCNKIQEEVAKNPTNADQLQGFLRSVRGFAYYGTSHAGYDSEDSSTDFSSRAVGRLNSAFEQFISSYGCKELALVETHPTRMCSSKPVFVDESSASHGIQRNSFFPVAADHISICRPESPSSNSFLYLTHFIHTTMQEVQYRNLNVRRKKPRGLAILISMEEGRLGSDIDRRRFVDMADYIKFCPVAIVDRRAEELRKIIQEVLRDVDDEDECILCCVSAHGFISGGKQFIYYKKEVPVELLSAVLEPIIACPKLVGKPKVFVINASRVFEQEPVVRKPDQIMPETVVPKPDQIMPEAEDCLLIHSCCPGESVWRRQTGYEKGTLFIGEVTDLVKFLHQTTDVQDIFAEVKRRVPELATKLGRTQVPKIHSSLTKRLSWRPR